MLLSEKSYNNPLGKCWDVIIDRPLGSTHPTFKETIYPINYGYIPGIIAGDGEEQDAYVVGISYPISAIHGKCIAIVHRKNDNEDKWIIAPLNMIITKQEIQDSIYFQEQYFDIEMEYL